MYIPVAVPAGVIMREDTLDAEMVCMCSERVMPRGKLCVYTHTVGSEEMHWFLCCSLACYTRNVTKSVG